MSDITIRNAALADAPRILEIYAYYVEHTVITFESVSYTHLDVYKRQGPRCPR